MKKLVLIVIICTMVFALVACAAEVEPTPEPSDDAANQDITPPVATEPEEAPEWVLWLAEHWGGDAEQWMAYAAADNKDIERWLLEHPIYGYVAEYNSATKKWDTHQQAMCTLLPVRSEAMPSTDDINKLTAIAEELVLQVLDAYCVGDERWSFQFLDYKFNGVTVDRIEEWRGDFWRVGTSFEATFYGFTTNRGSAKVPGETYVHFHPSYELVYGDGAYTIIPIYYDGSKDRLCGC